MDYCDALIYTPDAVYSELPRILRLAHNIVSTVKSLNLDQFRLTRHLLNIPTHWIPLADIRQPQRTPLQHHLLATLV